MTDEMKELIADMVDGWRLTITSKNGEEKLRIDARPEEFHAIKWLKENQNEVIAEIKRIKEAARIARKKEAERQKQEDERLLAKMHAEADELRKQIPADHVEVTATQTGSLDGDPIFEYKVGDFELSWQDVNHVGWALAIRPGALSDFASIKVASISEAKLEELKAAKIAAEKAKAEKIQAKKAKAKAELKDAFENELFVFSDKPIARAGGRLIHSLGAHISERDNRIAIYTTAYAKIIPNSTGTYEVRGALKAAGFKWDSIKKEWHCSYSPENAEKALGLLRQHDTKADPRALGLRQCWECGRWCAPEELNKDDYCGC